MNTKILKNVKKVQCTHSNIKNFTKGKQYNITDVLYNAFFLEGDDGSERYFDKLKNGFYTFIPINDEQQPTSQTNQNTPPHYQGTIQPIDLINAQDLNFNLGNVVKYVCRAGKKQGENILSDLEKAKDYINFEIKRVKK